VMTIVVVAAFLTPSSLLTMMVFAIPIAIAYIVGLVILNPLRVVRATLWWIGHRIRDTGRWIVTLGGRRSGEKDEPAD
jgi:hypothetical protein